MEIPQEVEEILSLGPNFATAYNNKNYPTEDIIATFESAITERTDEEKASIRKSVCNIITKEKRNNKTSKNQSELERKINKGKAFIKQHKELVITTADKSKKTVILRAEEYDNKMKTLLSDPNIYKKVRKDPTNILQNKNNEFIQLLTNESLISLRKTEELKIRNALPPKIYGLPKIHKENTPLRPIISCMQSPFYSLQKFLANILQNIVGKTEYNVKNSWELVEKIKGTQKWFRLM